jgi:hypothetical protein
MVKQYDEEEHKYYRLEAYKSEEVAELGEHAKSLKGEYNELPSPEIIAAEVKKKGYDAFDVTVVTEKTKRYAIE